MASLEKVKARIREIAGGNRKNVTLDDIAWVVDHLGKNGFRTAVRTNAHAKIFHVDSQTFSACTHRPGSSQLKRCYVTNFLNAMIELGLYED
jgi:hypothetical protein